MRHRPAIIAALPREVAPLVKGWSARHFAGNIWTYANGEAIVACAGMGPARAARAVQAAMEAMPITGLISAGLAGACDPALHAGEVVRAGIVIDSKTGERFRDEHFNKVLVTSDVVANVAEKARLRASYGASAVDMEAAEVARLAQAHGLDFCAIKTISDEADFEVEGLSRFATADGQFREIAFALHSAVRPRMWPKLLHLGQNSAKAIAALTEALESELDWYRREG